MSAAAEWLDRVDALARDATEGPWSLVLAWDSVHGTNYGADAPYDPRDGQWQDGPWPVLRGGMEEDAAFVVAARTDVPAMSAALRAVLDLHRTTPEGTCQVCRMDWYVEQGLTVYHNTIPIPAPCPTVRAVTEALT